MGDPVVDERLVLDTKSIAIDPGWTIDATLVAIEDLIPPVLAASGEVDGVEVVSLQVTMTEFCAEPTMLAAWLQGRAVGPRIIDGEWIGAVVLAAGTYLMVRLCNTSTERREVVLELRSPEKVTQLTDCIEEVEVLFGEVCPTCGLPARRVKAIPPTRLTGWDGPTMVHKYRRRVSRTGGGRGTKWAGLLSGCPLESS